jgi:hypothetical protein
MSKRCRSVLERAGLLGAVVAATGVFAIPVATAGGPPQGGGGCNMVANPSAAGLDHMMAGSANGEGQDNMSEMLSRFSPYEFCNPPGA